MTQPDPAEPCYNGNWNNLVPEGSNTRFESEAACVAYFQAGGEYIAFSPPSSTFNFGPAGGNSYYCKWDLWDFPPNAVVPVTIMWENGERSLWGNCTIDASGAGHIDMGILKCNDRRGVVTGIVAILPDGTEVIEDAAEASDLPCGKGKNPTRPSSRT